MPSFLKLANGTSARRVLNESPKRATAAAKVKARRKAGVRRNRTPASRSVAPAVVAMSRALRDARTRSGLSKTGAAEKIGVHFVTLYAWENENRADQPSAENLAKAAKAYGTTPATVLRRAQAIEQGISSTGSIAGSSDGGAGQDPALQPAKHRRGREASSAPAAATVTPKHGPGRPRKTADGAAQTLGLDHAEVALSGAAYARVLRVLAGLAEELSLPASALAAAQQVLTAPTLFDVFAAFTPDGLTDADKLAAIDATGVALRSFLSARE